MQWLIGRLVLVHCGSLSLLIVWLHLEVLRRILSIWIGCHVLVGCLGERVGVGRHVVGRRGVFVVVVVDRCHVGSGRCTLLHGDALWRRAGGDSWVCSLIGLGGSIDVWFLDVPQLDLCIVC